MKTSLRPTWLRSGKSNPLSQSCANFSTPAPTDTFHIEYTTAISAVANTLAQQATQETITATEVIESAEDMITGLSTSASGSHRQSETIFANLAVKIPF